MMMMTMTMMMTKKMMTKKMMMTATMMMVMITVTRMQGMIHTESPRITSSSGEAASSPPIAKTPALFTRMSIGRSFFSHASQNARTEVREARSSSMICTGHDDAWFLIRMHHLSWLCLSPGPERI